jgi:hypothetical protein
MVDASGKRHYLYAYRIGGDPGAEGSGPASRRSP